MIKLLRNTGVTLLLSGMLFVNTASYSVDNGFIANIKELKELSDIMNIIKENHVGGEDGKDPTNTTLMQGALKGMMNSLDDPHSTYFTKDELESFKEDIEGKYAGVGMVIQKKAEEPLIVVSPIEDTPAYLAGIKAKDKIIAIDGESTYNLTSEESVKRLKGEPGTAVKLTVYREDAKEKDKTQEVELKRAIIELKYVKSRMIDKNIGYLRLTQFGDGVSKDIEKDLKSLLKKGAKGVIFDLRSNPGGSLNEAVKIASMFISEGKIVSTKGKSGQEEIAMREGKYYGNFPLIILINEGSASASEIVSGAVKDYKRGILIGEKSFGKGSVQTLLPLPDGDGIKLTIAKYYTPNGISIHGIGITPDIVVEENDDFLFFNGFVTNINEKDTKENRDEIIKEIKGEKEAEKIISKNDIQLDRAVLEMQKLIDKKD